MTGGLLQLVAYGAQDIYLSSNPQITFFKLVYRRHTNFSLECIEQTFNGQAEFGKKVTATLSRNGDLVHKVWLHVNLPQVVVPVGTKFRWLNWLGHVLIQWVELDIGGQLIDKQYGEWMHIWCELSMKAGHMAGYANMVGNIPALTNLVIGSATPSYPNVGTGSNAGSTVVPACSLYIPLQFYFCKNPGLALPLISLQYHEVKITLQFRPLDECIFYDGQKPSISMDNAELLIDYVFLDTDERRRYATVSHEYLITQVQFTGDESTSSKSNKVKLSFNHPTKELIWVAVKDDYGQNWSPAKIPSGRQWFNFTTKPDSTWLTGTPSDPLGGGMAAGGSSVAQTATVKDLLQANGTFAVAYDEGHNPTLKAKLQLNGHDRFSERDGRYFNLCVPFCCHENVPATGINVYNFALRPEEMQPSGSLNMSRIDTAQLHIELDEQAIKDQLGNPTSTRIKIYALSYNVLRIMSGMGGLAYSN
jgi:hypothetical protein